MSVIEPRLSLYLAPVVKDLPDYWTDALSAVEQAKIARYRFEKDQNCSRFAHGFKRQILSRHLNTSAKSIAISIDDNSRPWLKDHAADVMDFNLSHSADWVAVAVMENGSAVGVDIERCRSGVDYPGIGKRVFHEQENATLAALEDKSQSQYFYRLWTIKEALSKSTGQGMLIGFDKIQLDINDYQAVVKSFPGDAHNWQISGFDLKREFSVAVAHQSSTDGMTFNLYCPKAFHSRFENYFGEQSPCIYHLEDQSKLGEMF